MGAIQRWNRRNQSLHRAPEQIMWTLILITWMVGIEPRTQELPFPSEAACQGTLDRTVEKYADAPDEFNYIISCRDDSVQVGLNQK